MTFTLPLLGAARHVQFLATGSSRAAVVASILEEHADPATGVYPAARVVPDGDDAEPLNPVACRDADTDSCDDCTSGSDDPANDGLDTDADGQCDAGDTDDDNDGVEDDQDTDPTDSNVCRDADNDSCDDCTNGSEDPDDDGTDPDPEGLCDGGDGLAERGGSEA